MDYKVNKPYYKSRIMAGDFFSQDREGLELST